MANGWSFERVRIKDSEYSAKCGFTGECLFWVTKGFIKITQFDDKTSVTYSITKIRCIAAFFARKLDLAFNNVKPKNWYLVFD